MQIFIFIISLQFAHGKNFGVQTVGIPVYDRVFRKAQQLNKVVTTAEKDTRRVKVNFNKAMQLSKKSTYEHGVKELQQRAQNALTLTMRGNVPVLSAKSAMPTRVKAGVNALNIVLRTHVRTLKDLATLPKRSKELHTRVQKFPSAFRAEMAENPLSVLLHLSQIRTLSRNVQTIGSIPQRATDVIKRINHQLKTIFSGFGQHWKNRNQ